MTAPQGTPSHLPFARHALGLWPAALASLALACGGGTTPNSADDQDPASTSAPPARKDAGPRDSGAASARDAAQPASSGPGASAEAGTRQTPDDNDPPSQGGPSGQDDPGLHDAGSAPTQPGSACGTGKRNDTPFGCSFAWGTNDPDDSLKNYGELSFLSKWVGYEVDKSGAIDKCDGCSWLGSKVQSSSAIPVYYAYFIGYFGSANGFADQNVNPDGPNLATDGAKLIRDHRAQLLDMYAGYAKKTAAAWPSKPLVWLLEGDFVQYTYDAQTSKLSLDELGALARDITCAIKGNMPNAVVALNHSTWLSDDVTNGYWQAMNAADYDLVWTTGVADNKGYFEAKADDSAYNKATATYAYVAKKTGRKILVDTSFGLSEMSDSWTSASASALNQRISDGVLAANVTKPAADYVATVENLSKQLSPVCK
jgi:hypothetical protein